ncbi:MAG: CoA-binding protein [Pirellulales bacterium]
MTDSSLSAKTSPTVAIVGASPDRSKYGNKSVRAHLAQGYTVYPVNPRGGEIEGLTVYKSLRDIPVARLNRISMYVGPDRGLELLDDIAAKGCDELWMNPGSYDDRLLTEARQRGLDPIVGCSIIDLHVSPDDFT